MKKEIKILIGILSAFFLIYFMPIDSEMFKSSLFSGLKLLQEYAKEHTITCLIPAFFIAGAITVFIKKDIVLKYLGKDSKKILAYSLASVSGAILAVCSCTILPIFAGIRKRGAGLGPAISFLFSGPAINIAAIFLTLSVLGTSLGLARIISAVILAVIIGITMQVLFKEKTEKGELLIAKDESKNHKKTQIIAFMASMIAILVVNGLKINTNLKITLIALFVITTLFIAIKFFDKETNKNWIKETWSFSKLLLPILFIGVFLAGFIMNLIPENIITENVGKNGIKENLIASIFGAFMYFSTLTEIPILQTLIEKGMNKGPALSLLLAGPSLSLPNMLVIRKILGNKKTIIYISLVIVYSTIAGLIYGYL